MLIELDTALSDILKILCRFRQPHSNDQITQGTVDAYLALGMES